MEPNSSSRRGIRFRRLRRRIKVRPYILALLAIFIGACDLWASTNLTSAEPDDAKGYALIARNVLDVGVFSTDEAPPFTPTIIRLPGYPYLIAGTYSVFGEGNNTAVQIVQGAVHALSAFMAGVLAWNWSSGKRRRKRRAAISAFLLSAVCPFTLVYSGVLLTETVTMFMMVTLALVATLAIKSDGLRSLIYWALAGIIAGAGVEFRPDFGLFAAGVGVTLVIATFRQGIGQTLAKGVVFSVLFIAMLTPWTIRNYRVFGFFQPIAPAHGEMPGEFVPRGYFLWLRTWITDVRYVDSLEWGLEKQRIDINSIPADAFTNDDERARVSALIDQYNNSDPEHPVKMEEKKAVGDEDETDSSDETSNETADSVDSDASQELELDLKISPDADDAFARIAKERIEDQPVKFYFVLPVKRMVSMWFDTHSDFYSFAGELLPLKDLDSETYQNIWLPLFIMIVWTYSLLALAGLIIMLVTGWPRSSIYALLLLLIILPRSVFIASLENPEPRYFVEYFAFVAILAGIFLSRFTIRFERGRLNITLSYARERIRQN